MPTLQPGFSVFGVPTTQVPRSESLHLYEKELLGGPPVRGNLLDSLLLLVLNLHFIIPTLVFTLFQIDLIPPEPVLVELGKAVDHDGDGQGEDENPGEGAKSAD